MSTVMPWIRRAIRLPLLVALLIGGLAWELLTFPWIGIDGRRASIRVWSTCLLRACGFDLRVSESEPGMLNRLSPGRLIIANHTSWVDIFAINAITATAFVAKSEIRDWPVIGWLVAMAGTVFIRKSTAHGRGVPEVVEAMRERIRQRHPVAYFPEGTTADGTALLRFHGRLAQAAIEEGVDLIPVAIRIGRADGRAAREALFIDDQSFMGSVMAIVGASGLVIEVQVLPMIPVAGRSRDDLAQQARELIAVALGYPIGGRGALPARRRG